MIYYVRHCIGRAYAAMADSSKPSCPKSKLRRRPGLPAGCLWPAGCMKPGVGMKKNTRFLVQAAVIAALYCALVILASLTPVGVVNFGFFQVRVSEALAVLPYFTPAAVPGLFVGCLVANVVASPFGLVDIVFGSLATLAAAAASRALRGKKWLVPLPAIVINAFVIGLVLYLMLKPTPSYWLSVLSVGAGQSVACYILGMPLLLALEKRRGIFL